MAHDRQRQFKKSGRHRQANHGPREVRAPSPPPSDGSVATNDTTAIGSQSITNQVNTPDSVESPLIGKQLESLETLVSDAIQPSCDSVADALPNAATFDPKALMQIGADLWSEAVERKLNSLVEQAKSTERERAEIELLREQLKSAIETAESRMEASASSANQNRVSELENQLVELNQENARLSNLLLNTRSEYQDLVDFIESEALALDEDKGDEEDVEDDDEIEYMDEQEFEKELEEATSELRSEIEQLNEQIKFLQSELTEFRDRPIPVSGDEAELRIQIEKLRSQLLEARHEAVEWRLQNNELSSSLAKLKGPAEGQRAEVMTWEQRKEALLRQLEAETHAEEPCDPRKVLEIEKVIQQTDDEIIRRDREIADLRALLEQQAIAQNGMAIGVAAVAEMIETDAMIISERMRLQELQAEWEQKQRQAEIEMSLERAKLARERLELQEKMQSFEDNNPPQTEDEKKSTREKTRGRWLARLGLRDE
jgi:hypothetical protein